ncbi:MAG: radical SAM protein [Pirellulales bacterium]|nr:radical SAM protein [Pirellulales bacterium]
MNEHVFGPVPSRRLGRSLGIDLVPFKTCTYDCIYCQLGRTTCRTTERKEWVSVDEIFLELNEGLAARPDYVTLSGSGEPTLCSRIGEVVDRVKTMTNVPLAVLTNGSLLWQEDVRRQLRDADLVIPSLDAGTPHTFEQVNRPDESLTFEKLLDGLITFRNEFHGKYWLEVLLVADLATDAEVAKIARHAERIRPDRIQLNTVTRPPADRCAAAVSRDRLIQLASSFRPPAEIIAEFRATREQAVSEVSRDRVVALIERRPCTLDDIAQGTGMHRNEVVKYIEYLNAQGRLRQTDVEGRHYYQTVR